jgi:hypothetical protein
MHTLPKVTQKEFLSGQITSKEVELISFFPKKKSSGPYGFINEFYKMGFLLFFVLFLLLCWVGVHCGIHKSSYNISCISYLNPPTPPFSFIPPSLHSCYKMLKGELTLLLLKLFQKMNRKIQKSTKKD